MGSIHIFVPLTTVVLGWMLGRSSRVGRRAWLGSALCFASVVVLALGGPTTASAAAVTGASLIGHLLGPAVIVAGVVSYALGRVRAQHLIGESSLDAEMLNGARMVMMGAFSLATLLISAVPAHSATRAIIGSLGSVQPAQW